MRKVSDVSARAFDDTPVGFDERIKLILERQNLIGRRSVQQGLLAGPDRGQPFSNVLEGAQPEPHLEKSCEQKAPAEQGKREHDRIG